MNPENILNSDFTDILFENRNKDYGAYYLRRHYQNYLRRAIFIMLAIIVFIIILAAIQKPKKIFQSPTGTFTLPIQPVLILTEVPPVPVPQKSIAHQNIAAEKLSTIKIIPPNDQLKEPLPDISEVMDKKISLISNPGNKSDITVPDENTIAVSGEGKAPETVPTAPPKPYNNNAVDEAAEFPGGLKAMLKFLQRNLHNPQNEMADPIQVRIQFIVDETGSVGSFKILQSGGEVFDKEVLNTLKKMPRWKPAVKNGRQVAVYFVQPITFATVPE